MFKCSIKIFKLNCCNPPPKKKKKISFKQSSPSQAFNLNIPFFSLLQGEQHTNLLAEINFSYYTMQHQKSRYQKSAFCQLKMNLKSRATSAICSKHISLSKELNFNLCPTM